MTSTITPASIPEFVDAVRASPQVKIVGAGTTLRELTATLAERGQHLPFDPPLVDAGATLGGTVAAGFDLPKFFAGSLGRFGALVECTFKGIPRALATRTIWTSPRSPHRSARRKRAP